MPREHWQPFIFVQQRDVRRRRILFWSLFAFVVMMVCYLLNAKIDLETAGASSPDTGPGVPIYDVRTEPTSAERGTS